MSINLTNNDGLRGKRRLRLDSQSEYMATGTALAEATQQAWHETTEGQTQCAASVLKTQLANKFLRALPDEDLARLLPSLGRVNLAARRSLDEPRSETGYVFFPEDAVVSYFAVFADGNTVEVAMTGRDGVSGLDLIFGKRPASHVERVTLAGSALKMKASRLVEEFARGGEFQRLLLEHVNCHFIQIAQRSACANRHKLDERLANWLLMMRDRLGADQLPLTQEWIADCLGARRAGITQAAILFQERGLISYNRGLIRLLDLEGLERAACECYGVLRYN